MPDDLNEHQRRARANAEKALRENHEREMAAIIARWGEVFPGTVVVVGILACYCWVATDLPASIHFFAAGVLAACVVLVTVIWWTARKSWGRQR